MRNLKLLLLSATFVVATAGLAVAGDCTKSTETASAKAECSKTATAQTASAKAEGACASSASAVKTASAEGGCASSASAVKTASAEGGCASSASAVKTASAEGGCASSAAVKTADAGSCASQANVAKAIKVETVRMPSGAMAVFYHGTNAEAVSYLQASAEKGCSGFACNLAKGMASDENCKVEMAKTESGVMMLVTSEKAEVLDGYAAQYAAVTAANSTAGDE